MKRFYKDVTAVPVDGGFSVALDGRKIKTVGGRPQVVPSQALASAMAQEWADQPAEIDPTRFILRDMADYAIDVVANERAETVAGLLPYAETDTLCYRADPDEALYHRQREVWEPVLTAAEARREVRFERVSGIMHRPQPAATLDHLRAELERADDFTLAALRNLASLAASLVIALEALVPGMDAEKLWDAASLEEEWQAHLWGRDEEAEERRAKRRTAFLTSLRFAEMARQG
ncbi:molecular chaperone [Novosphingobium sp. FSY-8]|uniref:Molecular chaperone n=1 Tax=Novosphingobium ovatum TaxID=1908523 RepID=A0ABW9XE18_9SPHN|nr:ATP12 family protein [Novosphingobium ovatum]NBC36776.1 molecular chaperone [Novosphingobium ovatum]